MHLSEQLLLQLLVLSTTIFQLPAMVDARTNISVALMYAYSFDPQVLGAPKLAFDDIEQLKLLPDFDINWTPYNIYNDAVVTTKIAVNSWRMQQQNTTGLRGGLQAIIGLYISTVCQNVALEAAAWNIPLISYFCQSQFLSDKTRYPTFFRSIGTLLFMSQLYNSFLAHYNWTRASIVSSKEAIWLGLSLDMQQTLGDSGVQVVFHVVDPIYDNPSDTTYQKPNDSRRRAVFQVIQGLKLEARSTSL